MKYIFFLVLALTFIAPVVSQSITEQAAKEELARRGLADQEDRIKAELSEYGIDINNVDVNNPIEVARVQAILEKIISKIEAEKKDELNAKTNKGEIVAPIEKSNSQESIKVDDTEVIKAEKDGDMHLCGCKQSTNAMIYTKSFIDFLTLIISSNSMNMRRADVRSK